MEPNSQLDALLDQSGMSRAGLATRVNQSGSAAGLTLRYDHTAVARWLKGQRPRGRVPEFLCEILGGRLGRTLTLADIGMAGPPDGAAPPPQSADGSGLGGFVERAALLWHSDRLHAEDAGGVAPSLLRGAAAVAPVWEWENPPADADVSHRGERPVGEAEVSVLQVARGHYERLYRNAGGVATRARVVGFLNAEVAPLLRGRYEDEVGRELFRAAGSLAAISGICAYDTDAQGLAQRYFHQALRLGKASGDRLFGGYVVSLLVNQALFLGDSRHAIACAEAVLRSPQARASAALTSDLYGMQAKAYAMLGDRGGAYACMRAAEAYSERIRPEEEPAETGYVQPGFVQVRLAEALLVLGEVATAGRYARESADAPAHIRGRVNRLATLADVELASGDEEQAAETAKEMVAHARGVESQRLRGRMRGLGRQLVRHRSAPAAEAAQLIDDALRVPL
ncbi:hypothetical protein [Streptomyces xiaopingdaonensis]|uniref:hypothetical protein n=1 Tax=Streptomyces xiaopingdaonensis TaxID=1565415 RepID=UPI00036E4E8A|nr:hypothetical protein [Streptomyces xiaopingdaonensis]